MKKGARVLGSVIDPTQSFDLTYALDCAKGGYTHMRHKEIRDTFATFMSEVCFDVEIEQKYQSFQGASFVNNSTTADEDARVDVKAYGLWAQGLSEPSLMSKSSTRTQKLHEDF